MTPAGGTAGRHSRCDGIALLVVMVLMILVMAVTSALLLTSTVEIRIAAVARDEALVQSAADAAGWRAIIDLRSADWNSALAGAVSSFTDGPPDAPRTLPDGSYVLLSDETADLTCGHAGSCTQAEIDAVDAVRPWGGRNPRWRLFGYGPLSLMLPGDPAPPPAYVVTWIADDPLDDDGDPQRDGDGADNPGRGVLVVAARAFGAQGARHTVEWTVERVGAELRILARHERAP